MKITHLQPIERELPLTGDPNNSGMVRLMSGTVFDDLQGGLGQPFTGGSLALRGLLEAMPALAWLTDRNGTVRFVNQRWAEQIGPDVLGTRIEDLVGHLHPEDRRLFLDRWFEVQHNLEGFTLECRWQNVRTEPHWYRFSLSPMRDPDGSLMGWLGFSEETLTSARFQAGASFLATVSEALSSSLDLTTTLSSLARSSVPRIADFCSVYTLDDNGLLERVETVHRDPTKAWASQALKTRFPHIDPATAGPIGEAMRTGMTIRINHPSTRAAEDAGLDFEPRLAPISQLIVPLKLHSRVIGLLNFGTNESGRRFDEHDEHLAQELARRVAQTVEIIHIHAAERAARQAAEASAQRMARLQTVTAALAEAYLPADVAEVVVYQTIQSLGADAGAVHELNHDTQQLELIRGVGHADASLVDHRTLDLERRLPVSDAAREHRTIFIENALQWNASYAPLTDPHGNPLNGAWIAVPLELHGALLGVMSLSFHTPRSFHEHERNLCLTLARQCALALERARLYAAERALTEQLEQRVEERTQELASRNAELEQFIHTASHDLRAPLLSIEGMTTLLSEGLERQNLREARFQLERVTKNVRRMNRLLEDLLMVARVGRSPHPPEVCDLGETVRAITHELEPRRSARGARLELPVTWPVVVMVPSELEQIISNLLGNALRYAGRIGEPPIIWLDWSEDNTGPTRQVRLRVADNGPGVRPEHREAVFQLFWKQDQAGTGVGLAIVKRIVEHYGGRIWLEDAHDLKLAGACFVLTLPTLP
jgi:signal transduction histidine kinase